MSLFDMEHACHSKEKDMEHVYIGEPTSSRHGVGRHAFFFPSSFLKSGD
jgi:hypothetical protein